MTLLLSTLLYLLSRVEMYCLILLGLNNTLFEGKKTMEYVMRSRKLLHQEDVRSVQEQNIIRIYGATTQGYRAEAERVFRQVSTS